MEFKTYNIVGIVVGVILIGISFFFYETPVFLLLVGLGVVIVVFPFIFSLMRESLIDAEKEEMFLEFARNLVESVKTGTPVSKSILNLKGKNFGVLTEHVDKLINQIYMGIPLTESLRIFSNEVNNKSVSRAIILISQAEKEGGEMGEILEAVAEAVSITDKLKKERKAVISSLVIQGYIIFIIFIIIILVMQFQIIPMVSGIAEMDVTFGGGGTPISQEEIASAFLYMLLIQGFFSGLVIGKISEGNAKAGIKHSFALMMISFLISAVSNFFFA
jgi:archaeal flagellar protein FlaJ